MVRPPAGREANQPVLTTPPPRGARMFLQEGYLQRCVRDAGRPGWDSWAKLLSLPPSGLSPRWSGTQRCMDSSYVHPWTASALERSWECIAVSAHWSLSSWAPVAIVQHLENCQILERNKWQLKPTPCNMCIKSLKPGVVKIPAQVCATIEQ